MNKLFLTIALFFQLTANAGDHLEPEDSVFLNDLFIGYHLKVVAGLEKAYLMDVNVRAIVMPSFHPEYAVGIRKKDGKYQIFHLEPEKQYWGYVRRALNESGITTIVKDREFQEDTDGTKKLESEYPKDFRDIPVKECEVVIDNALATEIINLWDAMLKETRYSERGFGLDGVNYHYSSETPRYRRSGKIWSPPRESKTGKLVALTTGMVEFCKEAIDKNELVAIKNKLKEALESER